MKVRVEEVPSDSGKDSYVFVELEDTGVQDLPPHVLAAAGEAAAGVLEHFRRAGTACGHRRWSSTHYCDTMICPQYVGWRRS